MKNSYKLALAAASVLCVCVLAWTLFPPGTPDDQRPVTAPPSAPPPTASDLGPAAVPNRPASPTGHARTTTPPRRDAAVPKLATAPGAAEPGEPPIAAGRPRPGRPARIIPPPAGQPAAARPVVRPPTPVTIAAIRPPAPAVKPATTPPARPGPRPYTIEPGDTYAAIAEAVYGSERYTISIAQANPLVDPLKLQPGQVIRLPHIAPKPARTPPPAELTDGSVYYVVRAEDTLSRIARQHYRDPRLWRVIYMANREPIGPDPDRIQPGARIIIPPPPTVSAG